jgi:hypothetical protein
MVIGPLDNDSELAPAGRCTLLRCMSLLVARRGPNGSGRACLLCPGSSDVNLFRYGKGIIDLDAKVRTVL